MVFHSFYNGENVCNLTEHSYYPQVPALQFPVVCTVIFCFLIWGEVSYFATTGGCW